MLELIKCVNKTCNNKYKINNKTMSFSKKHTHINQLSYHHHFFLSVNNNCNRVRNIKYWLHQLYLNQNPKTFPLTLHPTSSASKSKIIFP